MNFGAMDKALSIIDSASRCYVAFQENRHKKDLLEENNALWQSITNERQYARDLEDTLDKYKHLSESYWAYLQNEGYYHDSNGNLLKINYEDQYEDGDPQEDHEELITENLNNYEREEQKPHGKL